MRFLDVLPSTIRPILSVQMSLSLKQLDTLAKDLGPLSVLSTQPGVSRALEVADPSRNCQRFLASSSSITIGLKPFYSNKRPNICRAHIYFASQVRICKLWCKYPKKQSLQMQPSLELPPLSPLVHLPRYPLRKAHRARSNKRQSGLAFQRHFWKKQEQVSQRSLYFSTQFFHSLSAVSCNEANGTPIKFHGELTAFFTLPLLRREFNWIFLVAEVATLLLGIDFNINTIRF